MRVAIPLALASVATAACHATPQRILSIHEVIGNIDRLNGQTVRVGGYLPSCGGYDCRLFARQGDVEREAAWFAAVQKEHKLPSSKAPEWLGIGSDGEIDRKAAPLAGHYVIITGRVDNRCRYHGEWGCTDRGPDIHPQGIEAWQPPPSTDGTTEKKG